MESELIYSKFTKVVGSKTKSAMINISDQYLNNFIGKDVFVKVELIKAKATTDNTRFKKERVLDNKK